MSVQARDGATSEELMEMVKHAMNELGRYRSIWRIADTCYLPDFVGPDDSAELIAASSTDVTVSIPIVLIVLQIQKGTRCFGLFRAGRGCAWFGRYSLWL